MDNYNECAPSGCHELYLICHLKNVESILLNSLRVEE